MGFWDDPAFTCAHRGGRTPPDAHGVVLCMDCGTPIQQQLTAEMFDRAIEQVSRLGVHSMRCVDTGGEWVCAPECPSRSSH